MDNKENLENVVKKNETSTNEVTSSVNEKMPSTDEKPKKKFWFNKKKDNNPSSNSNEQRVDVPLVNEVADLNVSLANTENKQIDSNATEAPVMNNAQVLSNADGLPNQSEVVVNDEMPMVKSEDVNIGESQVTGAIFDPNAMEAATNQDNVVSNNGDNFVPPADFTAIFNVSSEETPVLPSTGTETPTSSNVNNVTEVENSQNTNDIQLPVKDKKEHEVKKEVFNSNERILYEIKPEKEGNPIVVILFFLLLLGSIVILPYISKQLEYDKIETTETTEKSDEEDEEYYYFNRSSVRAAIGGLEFTNFVKHTDNGEYFVTFNITNKNDRAYQYDKKYYLVFYDGTTLAYRALIHTYDVIGANAVQEITLTINERGYKNSDRFKIIEIPVTAYPNVDALEKDGDYSVLKCNYRNDEIKYYFLENKLVKLVETYTETMEGSRTYENDKSAYKNLSDSYKRVGNFTSTFIEANNYFTMINEFNHRDISDATLANLKTYKFFKYNENINTVSFELEAQGYTCG